MGKAKSGKKQDNAKAVRQLSLPPFPVPLRILISRPLPRRRQRRPRRPSRRQRRPRRTRSRSRRRRARRRTRRTRWTRATFCARSRSTARSGQRSTRSRVRPRLARSHRARCNGAKLTAPPPPSLSAEDIVEGPPSRRANATLTASPVADHLYLFGGEYYDGQRVELFADVRPSVLFPRCCANLALTLVVVAAAVPVDPGKNEWRRFTSPTQPSPRAAHAAAVTTAGGGRLWIHGGEYCAARFSPHRSLLLSPTHGSRYSFARCSCAKPELVLPLPRPLVLLVRHQFVGALGRQDAALCSLGPPHGRLQELHLPLWRASSPPFLRRMSRHRSC